MLLFVHDLTNINHCFVICVTVIAFHFYCGLREQLIPGGSNQDGIFRRGEAETHPYNFKQEEQLYRIVEMKDVKTILDYSTNLQLQNTVLPACGYQNMKVVSNTEYYKQ